MVIINNTYQYWCWTKTELKTHDKRILKCINTKKRVQYAFDFTGVKKSSIMMENRVIAKHSFNKTHKLFCSR